MQNGYSALSVQFCPYVFGAFTLGLDFDTKLKVVNIYILSDVKHPEDTERPLTSTVKYFSKYTDTYFLEFL